MGHKVIGAGGPEGLSWAVMPSGVTLVAVASEAVVARECGTRSQELAALVAPYGPGRFESA
jgi:hypothetical protein